MFLLSILGVRQKWPLKNKIILFSLHKIIRTVKRLKIIKHSFLVLFYMMNLLWWTNNKHKIPLLGRAEYVLQAWVCTSLLLFTQTVEYWVQLYTKSVCTECTLSVDSSEIWRRGQQNREYWTPLREVGFIYPRVKVAMFWIRVPVH